MGVCCARRSRRRGHGGGGAGPDWSGRVVEHRSGGLVLGLVLIRVLALALVRIGRLVAAACGLAHALSLPCRPARKWSVVDKISTAGPRRWLAGDDAWALADTMGAPSRRYPCDDRSVKPRWTCPDGSPSTRSELATGCRTRRHWYRWRSRPSSSDVWWPLGSTWSRRHLSWRPSGSPSWPTPRHCSVFSAMSAVVVTGPSWCPTSRVWMRRWPRAPRPLRSSAAQPRLSPARTSTAGWT